YEMLKKEHDDLEARDALPEHLINDNTRLSAFEEGRIGMCHDSMQLEGVIRDFVMQDTLHISQEKKTEATNTFCGAFHPTKIMGIKTSDEDNLNSKSLGNANAITV
ncbi:unnamed protein product, partial [Rotaria magnacalcarata]